MPRSSRRAALAAQRNPRAENYSENPEQADVVGRRGAAQPGFAQPISQGLLSQSATRGSIHDEGGRRIADGGKRE